MKTENLEVNICKKLKIKYQLLHLFLLLSLQLKCTALAILADIHINNYKTII